MSIHNVSRRDFLKNVGLQGGGLVIATQWVGHAAASSSEAVEGAYDLGVFVSINGQGDVQIVNHRAEMGQGIITSVPQVIADELGAAWSRVSIVQAKGDAKYGPQGTGGSASIRRFFPYLRQMGAIAREMLEQAAANHWQVDKKDVVTRDHQVLHRPTGKALDFGALAEAAGKLPVPKAEAVTLKKHADFSLIGKDVKLAVQPLMVTGKAQYAQDVQLSNMLIASIQRPPVVGGRVKSFDATEAKKVAGVVQVIRMKDRPYPVDVRPLGGVAVLATNTWAAHEGRKKLKIEWDTSEKITAANAKHESKDYLQQLVKQVSQPGKPARKRGDVYAHKYSDEKTLEATYTVPYHHHMPMETPAATAIVSKSDKGVSECRVWTGTQNPQWARGLVAAELGIDQSNVEVNMTLMGGAFGRKGKNDYTVEAAELAHKSGRPVKVVWTREDDVKHGFYHSIAANYFKAELNDKGSADHWLQRVAYPPIGWIFNTDNKTLDGMALSLGFADVPFELTELSCEKYDVETHVRTGWFRAVANINNAFALGCFVDELAVKAKIPTHKMWLNLFGKDRLVDPSKDNFGDWTNYGQESDAYALDTRRMKAVVTQLVQTAKADKPLPKGEGWGISYAHSFNSYVAAATRVKVIEGKWQALEMHTIIDCGIAITPDRVKSQMEGAMIMGLTMALAGEITVKEGAVQQNNFYDYPVARIQDVPPLHVEIVQSYAAPGGVGEPGLPPILPSIVNAIFHASGQRVRSLPVDLA